MKREERKPTVEEMVAACHQYSARIEEVCRRTPVGVDFSKLPPPYRRTLLSSRVGTISLAAVAMLLLVVLPIPAAGATTAPLDYTASVETIDTMIINTSGE